MYVNSFLFKTKPSLLTGVSFYLTLKYALYNLEKNTVCLPGNPEHTYPT